MDYIEGFYEADTTKLVRSASPSVVKYGYVVKRGESAYSAEAMPWTEFMFYANGVKTNNRQAPASAPKEVVVYDVPDQTAAKSCLVWERLSASRQRRWPTHDQGRDGTPVPQGR